MLSYACLLVLGLLSPNLASASVQNYTISVEQESSEVAFTNTDGEVSFNLKVPQGQSDEIESQLQVYNYDGCGGDGYGTDIVDAAVNTTIVTSSGGYDYVPVNVDIKTANLTNYVDTTLYNEDNTSNEANITFCLRADIGSMNYTNNGIESSSSISFVKLLVNITIDLEVGFSSADLDLREEDAADFDDNVTFPGKKKGQD